MKGKVIENFELGIKKKIYKIENDLKNKCYSEKSFYEKDLLKETSSFFKKNKIKKIKELTTDAGYRIFVRNYYFIEKIMYVQYDDYLFDEEVKIHFLDEANLNIAKKSLSEFYIYKGEIIKMLHNGKKVTSNQKIKIQEKFIIGNLNEYIFLSKYLNKPNYREYEEERWGMRKRFPLCGKEKAVKLTYTFNRPFFIEIIDSNEKRIYEIEEMPKENKETTVTRIIPLSKDKKFDLDSIQISITSLTPGSKWRLRIEFEGEE